MINDYTVIGDDGIPICQLNESLAEQQGLSAEDINDLKTLHKARHEIEDKMAALTVENDTDILKSLFHEWRNNAFHLQKIWGFLQDSMWHRDYTLPHCRCPVMDNDDRLGTPFRVITGGCIYHDRTTD